MRHFFLLLLLVASVGARAQKEVLIVGVMPQLPEVVRTSYGSLLRIAKDYQPQAIYVQSVPPTDEQSWALIDQKGVGEMFDFWQIHRDLQTAMPSSALQFDKANHGRAVGYFQHRGDYANTIYYLYLINGVPKHALGDEYYDLSLPLAVAMGIDSLRSFGTRIFDAQYVAAINRAKAEWAENGNGEAYVKLFSHDYNQSVLPAMFGNYGRHTNSTKALQRAHSINTFGFAVTKTEATEQVEQLWRASNELLAERIGQQIEASDHQRSIVFVDCGRVVGLSDAIKSKFSSLNVKLIDQIKK